MLYSRTPFETPAEGVTPLAILSGKYTHPSSDGNTPTATRTEFLRSLIDASLVTYTAARATTEQLKELFPATRSESDRHLDVGSIDENDDASDAKSDGSGQASEQRRSGHYSPMGSPRATNFAITSIPEDEAVAD